MDCRRIFQRFLLRNAGQSYVLTERIADRQNIRSRLDAFGIKLLQDIGIIEDLIELFREFSISPSGIVKRESWAMYSTSLVVTFIFHLPIL